MIKGFAFLFVINLFLTSCLWSQQVADSAYSPVIAHPEYSLGNGPVVLIDEGHNNFHTAGNRYLPFARLLTRDGYNVGGYTGEFESERLKKVKILVIANALNAINTENWYLPTPSAFSAVEISVLREWVNSGGSLFLIADHMPMGGAAKELANAFGFIFTNGFAMDTSSAGPAFFYRNDNTLLSNTITNGRSDEELVNKIVSFTGQGFRIPDKATSIIKFNNKYTLLESDTAWIFDSSTKKTSINGWSQGAFMEYGKGRLVMFGEAAMFSAQLAGPTKARAGMNADYAEENYKLLLNIIHWLDGRFD
jgi:hypothetical protein